VRQIEKKISKKRKEKKEKLISTSASTSRRAPLSPIQCCLSYPYLILILLVTITVLRTRIGQQLGQVCFWTIIQHCYLILNCVPHTYTFEPPIATHIIFRSLHPEDLAILVPLPHRYHEPATGCTVHCSCW